MNVPTTQPPAVKHRATISATPAKPVPPNCLPGKLRFANAEQRHKQPVKLVDQPKNLASAQPHVHRPLPFFCGVSPRWP
ncbi:MAG: hypothetical protein B7Y77_02180 [Bradyrhizobium sp. 35-63-5]|nr:MAG: hypothetical protein B7Y77_02180 [Bradyrhizobium sp. 35-63-5]